MTSCGDTDLGARRCREPLRDMLASRPGANEARLASVIFDDIVPRLQMLHHELSAKNAESAFTRNEIAEFAEIVVVDDAKAADQFLQRMRACGHSEETLFLGLLSETARHLGALWEDDRCNFVDVTIGVARLQKILCASSGHCEPAFGDSRQRLALCALPGERHIFGVDMVACFMRHAAWEVDLHKDAEADDVVEIVAGDWFAVLGFTVSSELGLDALCRAIQSGRAASINPQIGILVGGPLFRREPGLVAQVGADAMAGDAASATLLAKKLLLRQQSKAATQENHQATRGATARSTPFIQASKA
ncbi:cobalamin B12-binding domain-containing protein [Methylocystis parvus]|uniref:cobalamin B12-binding domain-containing protein n=1 Tax=Methylocystis parvus TaxID=134 RepID=UPI003C78D1A0